MSGVQIQSDPAIMMGKPVIAGTRLTVEMILEKRPPARLLTNCWRRIPG